ncbi:NUDIX domain-containing protein [Thelonectria olida]|uniref:NUDIX domain-containing protein n=1 Tax=Thelonectria olida TaxID=1576542 RepID=A0A9P9AVF3_9HYPO|nr:NUDIX domain-containing protein [Thelonectria olida]
MSGTSKVVSVEELSNADAKWLSLVKINYEDGHGKLRTWEGMKRRSRPRDSIVDAVQVVALLQRPTGPEVLLEKQFRPPTAKVCIEFPAGLIDEGETPDECALRELKEETGYVGEVIPERTGVRPILMSAPASSSSKTFMIHVKIDPARPENQTPVSELEDGEFIECFWVPLKDLYEACRKLQDQGFAIDGKVGAFAEGIETSKLLQ